MTVSPVDGDTPARLMPRKRAPRMRSPGEAPSRNSVVRRNKHHVFAKGPEHSISRLIDLHIAAQKGSTHG
jgi:hypothetical protein